jgi:8-oxo-dGTP diphosphatase
MTITRGHRDHIGVVPYTIEVYLSMVLQQKKKEVTRKRNYCYEFEMAAVTVDGVVFGYDPKDPNDPLRVLLTIRGGPDGPFVGWFALPGGYVEMAKKEDLETAVTRELLEETGAKISYLEQLFTFGKPDRDPRGRVISVAYFGLVRKDDHVVGGRKSDAADSMWLSVKKLNVKLAFDHADIIKMALERLQAKVRYAPIGFNLLPQKFTIGDLQQLYEAILQKSLNRSNFRRRILAMEILTEVGTSSGRSGPPAKLYRFDKKAYDKAVQSGFNFEI